jgi:hypothetical protein
MQNLVGRRFSIEDTAYDIVDVRNIQGDTLIYAELATPAAGPGRAAFRYADIESHLQDQSSEIA